MKSDEKAYKEKPLGPIAVAPDVFKGRTLQDVYDQVVRDLDSVEAFFREAAEIATRNSAFVAGEQWTDEEKLAHEMQRRVAYVFDQIEPKVNALLGAHAQTRIDAKPVPVEEEDAAAAEVAARLVKWFEQVNDINTVQDQIFRDAVVKGLGVAQVRWETMDGYGYPKVERIPFYQIRWDGNAIESTLEDARWIARIIPMTRQSALEEFPDYGDIIENVQPLSSDGSIISMEVLTPRQRENWTSRHASDTNAYDIIRVVEHFERVRLYNYIVYDEYDGVLLETENLKEAEEFAQGRLEGLSEGGKDTVLPGGADRVQVVSLSRIGIVHTLVIGDQAVFSELSSLPAFPYVVAMCYHDDGVFWSFVDKLIDPQIFTNRMISEWDNQIGRSNKNIATVIEGRLKKGWSVDKVSEVRSQTAPTIPVVDHEALRFHPPSQASPDLPVAMQFAIGHMTDIVGGKNALGLQENAAESGAAVRQRQEAAGLGRLPIFAHINRWRRMITELALWYMRTYMTPGRHIRIIGDSLATTFYALGENEFRTLESARVDIVVTEALDSATMQERQFIQVKELFQVLGAVVPADVMLDTMLEYSSLPESSKQRIRERVASMQEYLKGQEEKQRQEELEASVERSLDREELKTQKKIERALKGK